MTNHVYLVAVSENDLSLAKTMKYVHGRFAQFWNALAGSTGHTWQNGFYSCPMDWSVVDRVIRYVERNPVREPYTPSRAEGHRRSARLVAV